MKRIRRRIVFIFLILFSFLQIMCIFNLKDTNNKFDDLKKVDKISNKNINISEIISEINRIEGVNVTEAKEIQGRCKVKVKIEGNKPKILEDLSLIKSYNINGYKIIHTTSNNSLILEMIY